MANPEWAGIVSTTMPKYLKGAADHTIRNRLLLSLLKKKGRIELNAGGTDCRWDVEFSQPDVSSYADGGQLDFSNHDAFRQLVVDWRGYVATDTLTQKQKAMNSGTEALVNLFQTKNSRLTKAMSNNFCAELYKDGGATGRDNCIHGIETFMGTGTNDVADIAGEPDDTYGNTSLSTAPGNQGGSWSTDLGTSPNANLGTDWPYGNGDSEYDYLSPKQVNYGSTSWVGTSNTWASNGWYAMGAAITWLTTGNGQEGAPDICVLAPDLFQGYKDSQESIRRINVPHKGAQDLGFANVLNQDGVAIQSDFDCPAATGYMINLDTVTIRSLMPQLFWFEGPDKDPRSGWSYLWGVGFYGNVTWSPKHTAKFSAYAID